MLKHVYKDVATAVIKRIPFLFLAQGLVLGVALVAALTAGFYGQPTAYQTVAFALPAQTTSSPWYEEVDLYADRVSRAFGISSHKADEFAGWILEASTRHEVEADVLASLVLTESSFRKNVRSHVGAVGPAQVRADYWSKFCGTNKLDDPAENIYCGAQILSYFEERCGAIDCALHAYNVGQYNRDSYRELAGARYVAKIDRLVEQLGNTSL